jgi:RNA polymerase sigma factor (sigma-70 family)
MPALFARLRRYSAGSPERATDEELVARIQQGDTEAWGAFLGRYSELLYGKAWEYSRLAGCEERGEEVADLYLFMAESLLRSFKAFRRICKPRTWVLSVVGSRKQVVKAYLLHRHPERAEVRLPKVLETRPPIDREIFRRLVWGLEPAGIALELGVPESCCTEVETLLAEHSPRVHARILANRQARIPALRLDASTGEEEPPVQLAHPGANPEEEAEERALRRIIHETIAAAVGELSNAERRVLILLYNQGMSPAQIAELAPDQDQGLGEIADANRCYYLKDRALDQIAARLTRGLESLSGGPLPAAPRRRVLRALEEFLREQGVPLSRG